MTEYCPWCRRKIGDTDKWGDPQEIVLVNDYNGKPTMFHKRCDQRRFKVSLW